MITRAVRRSTRRPKTVLLVWIVVGVLLGVLGALKGYAVTTDDTARFLPSGSESALALDVGKRAFGVQDGTAVVTGLAERADGAPLSATDREQVGALATRMGRWRPDVDALKSDEALGVSSRAGRVLSASTGAPADHGRLELVNLQWKANATDDVAQAAYRQFRDRFVAEADRSGLRLGFTGGVATASDQTQADATRTLIQQLALFGLVIAITAVFFRGVLAAIAPLLTIILVASAASGLIVGAALVFGFTLDTGTTQLISVVLIGVGVDYFLFLLFRLREHLRAGEDKRTAARDAALRIGPVIASAALVVIAAFSTLALAQFGQFRVLGPSIAISVALILLAGVTLMPAIAALAGPRLFWPSQRWREDDGGRAGRLGKRIARTPGATALLVGAVLVVLALIATGTHVTYDLSSGGTDTAATRTADRIAEALPRGAIDPQPLYVQSNHPLAVAELAPLRARLRETPGVGDVAEPVLAPGRRAAQIDVVLDDDATTQSAMDTVRGPLRTAAREGAPAGTSVLVAGTAAVYADVSDSVSHDLRLIFPVAAGLIFLILLATLRSLRASISLLAVVALEFAATMGFSVLVIQGVFGEAGVAFTLPLVVFLFVVAVGTDYNMLVTARLREELAAHDNPRTAVAEAVRRVGPAVAAAGLVLAGSFATLMIASDAGAREIGLALTAGILIASMLVSTILVPAVTAIAARSSRTGGRVGAKARAVR